MLTIICAGIPFALLALPAAWAWCFALAAAWGPLPIAALAVGILLVFAVLPAIVMLMAVGYLVFTHILKRGVNEDWGRHCSTDEVRHVEMYDEGMAWRERVKDRCVEVHIVSEGLNLYGEYFDFGSDVCVIFLPGRMESLHYSYYFLQPYEELGVNMLSIDPRAHGLSDGSYNTVGFEESKDIVAWSKFLIEEYHIRKILLHGVCIGAAGGLLASVREDCPSNVAGLIADGLFANFGESMKNHLVERKKPLVTMWFIDFWMKRLTGHSMRVGPMNVIADYRNAILFLHSKADPYSNPPYTRQMYDLCPSEQKKLVWFEGSDHSMLRYDHTEQYDREVIAFAKQVLFADGSDRESQEEADV